MRAHLRSQQEAGIDQVIFLQQAGHNRHDEILAALELFAREVAPEFQAEAAARDEKKRRELAPHVEAALLGKRRMAPLSEKEIPIVPASRPHAEVNRTTRER